MNKQAFIDLLDDINSKKYKQKVYTFKELEVPRFDGVLIRYEIMKHSDVIHRVEAESYDDDHIPIKDALFAKLISQVIVYGLEYHGEASRTKLY